MHILGVANNDCAGAALISGNEIIAAVSEERFSRIKDHKTWPAQSIQYVLEEAKVRLSDIDDIAFGWSRGFDVNTHLRLYVERYHEAMLTDPGSAEGLLTRAIREADNDRATVEEFQNYIDSNCLGIRLHKFDHHECHGLGAFTLSGFDEALVVTSDGRGDFQSLTVAVCSKTEQKVLQRETSSDSLGYFFGAITKLLGFIPNRHEGKITGLAAFGNEEVALPLMREMIGVDDGRVRIRDWRLLTPYYEVTDALKAAAAPFSQYDIAAAAQRYLENIMVEIIAQHLDSTGVRNVCLSGGVFANVKLNQRIGELPDVTKTFVLPCMGDGGLPLASAAVAARRRGFNPVLRSMALGPRPSPNLAAPSRDHGLLIDDIVQLLGRACCVGIVRGRMEYGPRALCNRSILCDPRSVALTTTLNERLGRNDFMPFAPVTIDILATKCFIGWKPDDLCAKYMTRTYPCTEFFTERCSAAVHIDGTARPQVISASENHFIFELIERWYEETGCPALINTSFNVHEEPIICTAEQGERALRRGVVDALLVDETLSVNPAFGQIKPARSDD